MIFGNAFKTFGRGIKNAYGVLKGNNVATAKLNRKTAYNELKANRNAFNAAEKAKPGVLKANENTLNNLMSNPNPSVSRIAKMQKRVHDMKNGTLPKTQVHNNYISSQDKMRQSLSTLDKERKLTRNARLGAGAGVGLTGAGIYAYNR
ncbi:MAG: hypothetical protein U9R12_01650 [Candidatus Caldatribacteriota bacterium]|nr:hypothetical protein [Candidatus Caldatribacteriota bacterium]